MGHPASSEKTETGMDGEIAMEEDLKASTLEPIKDTMEDLTITDTMEDLTIKDTMEDPTIKDTMEDLTIMDTMEDLTIMDLVVVGLTVVAEFQVHIYFLVLDNRKEN